MSNRTVGLKCFKCNGSGEVTIGYGRHSCPYCCGTCIEGGPTTNNNKTKEICCDSCVKKDSHACPVKSPTIYLWDNKGCYCSHYENEQGKTLKKKESLFLE